MIQGCGALAVVHTATAAAALVRSSLEYDLAVLRVPAGIGSTPATLRQSALLGEDVVVAGYPLAGLLSSDLTVTRGIVNALTGLANAPLEMQISAQIHPGNSGGPVLDAHGAVVGVVVSKLNAIKTYKLTGDIPQNINFAIKPEYLTRLLDGLGVPVSLAPSSSPLLDGAQIAQRARAFTVQVQCLARPAPDSNGENLKASLGLANKLANAAPPVPHFADTESRLTYLRWLAAMSPKLAAFRPDWQERKELLQTVWYEANRAGLDPAVVLAMIDALSAFHKFQVTEEGSRGYMAVAPGIARLVGNADPGALFHSQTNLRYGCVFLRHYLVQTGGNMEGAIRQYVSTALNARPADKRVRVATRDILERTRRWRFDDPGPPKELIPSAAKPPLSAHPAPSAHR